MANQTYDSYVIGVPREGLWRVRFNSDWNGYSPDFQNHASLDTWSNAGDQDGMSVMNQSRHLLSATGGSLVVCLVTPSGVYLSADSRYADAPAALRDSARKLLACGPTALCVSGLLRFTRTECGRCGDDLASETTFELSDVVDGLDLDEAPPP